MELHQLFGCGNLCLEGNRNIQSRVHFTLFEITIAVLRFRRRNYAQNDRSEKAVRVGYSTKKEKWQEALQLMFNARESFIKKSMQKPMLRKVLKSWWCSFHTRFQHAASAATQFLTTVLHHTTVCVREDIGLSWLEFINFQTLGSGWADLTKSDFVNLFRFQCDSTQTAEIQSGD